MQASEPLEPLDPLARTRRHFLRHASLGLGSLALGTLLPREAGAAPGGILGAPHFPPKARRVIYLFQAGGPAVQDLVDYKPLLNEKNGEQLPAHVRGGQRLTTMSVNQARMAAFRSKDVNEKAELQAKLKEAQKDADEKLPALYREVVAKHADSPYAVEAATSLLQMASKIKPTAAEVTGWAKVRMSASNSSGEKPMRALRSAFGSSNSLSP